MTVTYTTQPVLNGGLGTFQNRFEPSSNADGSFAAHTVPEVNGNAVTTDNPLPVSGAFSIADGATVGLTAGTAAIGSTIVTPGALTNSAAVTAGETAAIVVPYSATRKFVHVFSRTTGTETVDLGSSNVAVGSGIPISGGGGFSFLGSGAEGPIYAITTVSSSPLSYVEG